MIEQKIKHVIFDVDGVITPGYRASELAVEKFGLDFASIKRFFTSNEWQKCVEGKVCLEDLLSIELPKWGFQGTMQEYLQYWFETENIVNNEVLDLVTSLREKGIGCSIGSNQEKKRASYLWNECGLSNHFDFSFFSFQLGCTKPQIAFYHKIQSLLKTHPEEILLIDDSSINIKAAKEFSWKGLLWPQEKNLIEVIVK
jgi:putative hydrolase of the HAD superfamily